MPDFPTTSWTLIRTAQQATGEQRATVLGLLIRQYWKPIYAFFRASQQSRADSEDLVQGLWQKIVTGDVLRQVDPVKGRFRDWLLVCARNHLRDHARYNKAQRRRPTGAVISFEQLRKIDGQPYEPSDDNAVEGFREAWRRDLLERAVTTVRDICRQQNRFEDYEIFCEYYFRDMSEPATWKQIAQRHRLSDWKIAARKAEWVKRNLRKSIRNEVRRYVDSDAEVEQEIRELLQ